MSSAARACAAVLLASLLAAACAGGPGDAPAGDTRGFGGSDAPGEGPRVAHGELNIFISPSGEPFHGGRDAPYAASAWFAQADADHDGRLSAAEFRADARRAFERYDTNHDGVIDAFEIQHYEQAIAPEILPRIEGLRAGEGMDESLFKGRRARRSVGGGGGGSAARREIAGDRQAQGGGLYGVLAEPEPLTAADVDLSGTVTLSEWMTRTDRRFALLDTDARGYLTLDALPKTQAQLLLERRRAREAEASRRGRPPQQPRRSAAGEKHAEHEAGGEG